MPEETSEEWETHEKVSGQTLRDWYSKEIWGQRATNDDTLFEVMSLQVFQAGLTWRMVLSRRDSFRTAFANWKINYVADMDSDDVARLREDPGIIRNQQKIQAVISNARVVQGIQNQHGSFCNWFYDVLQGTDYPSLQKELRSTFKFMGPEISRMWLMASGRISRQEGDKYDPTV